MISPHYRRLREQPAARPKRWLVTGAGNETHADAFQVTDGVETVGFRYYYKMQQPSVLTPDVSLVANSNALPLYPPRILVSAGGD